MTDGAHQGILPEKAIKAIFGEDEPTEDERMSVHEMRNWLLSAPPMNALSMEHIDYNDYTRSMAGEIFRWALANPQRYAHIPMESEYSYDDAGKATLIRPGLYSVLKEEGIDMSECTGFQWGWAYNAARRCLELPSEPNPAIITIEG